MKRKAIIIVAGLLMSVAPVFAQRTAPGTGFLSLDFLSTFESFGGQVSYGHYFQHFYVVGGVNGAFRTDLQPYTSSATGLEYEYNMHYCQVTATGDWMYRLIGTRSRVFTLNAGAGVLLGAEIYDTKGEAPEGWTKPGEKDASFIYGFDVRLDMELFAFKRTAFVLSGRLPLTFGSECSIFNYEVALGLRFNL